MLFGDWISPKGRRDIATTVAARRSGKDKKTLKYVEGKRGGAKVVDKRTGKTAENVGRWF